MTVPQARQRVRTNIPVEARLCTVSEPTLLGVSCEELVEAVNPKRPPSPMSLLSEAPHQRGHSDYHRIGLDYVPIASLIPANRALRRAEKRLQEQIQRNIRRFGIVRPILVQRNGTIIAGHGVYEAARALGWTEVPVTCLENLTDAEARVLGISLHKMQEMSSWDPEALAVELSYIVDTNPDLTVFTGFTTSEIDVQLSSSQSKVDKADTLTEAAAGPPVSRRGDIWIFKGGHRLLCADVIDPSALHRLMAQIRARLVLSDPPFNVKVAGHVSGRSSAREFAMASGEMTAAEFAAFLTGAFQNAASHSLDGSLALYFMDWRHIEEMMTAGRMVYSELKNLIVWTKTNAGMGSLWRSQHELIFAWKLGSAPHINNVELGKNGRWRSNVWPYAGANAFGQARDADLAGHVTPKSVALLYDAILDVTERGDAVLDPFAGAGSTLVAAHRARRVGYGVEIDPLYVDTAVRRLQDFIGADAYLEETGRTFAQTMAERSAASAPA